MSKALKQLESTMQQRKYSPNSISAYTGEFWKFEQFCKNRLNKTVDRANQRDVQNYFHVAKLPYARTNHAISSIKFYYEQVKGQKKKLYKITRPRKPHTLPNVIEREELLTKINRTPNLKAKALLSTAYSVGMRISEVVQLRTSDILSERKRIKIVGGKGKKDRYVPLSPKVLKLLRMHYIKHRPEDYIFKGANSGYISPSTARKYFKQYISPDHKFHALRHSFATHMLEMGFDISIIQKILGHKNIETTLIYTQVTDKNLDALTLPF